MTYKIVFFDIDGTLTDERNGSIPPKTKEAVQKLFHKGIKVVAATGRPLSMCEEIKNLGIDTFITANGGYATHEEAVVHQTVLDRSVVQEISLFAAEHFHGLSYLTKSLSMNGIQSEQIAQALKETLSLNEYPVLAEAINSEDVFFVLSLRG